MGNREEGWYGLACWNGLSGEQQTRLVMWGNLPIGYKAEGTCERGAEVMIETIHDEAPGPRFYCAPCAVEYLKAVADE